MKRLKMFHKKIRFNILKNKTVNNFIFAFAFIDDFFIFNHSIEKLVEINKDRNFDISKVPQENIINSIGNKYL